MATNNKVLLDEESIEDDSMLDTTSDEEHISEEERDEVRCPLILNAGCLTTAPDEKCVSLPH